MDKQAKTIFFLITSLNAGGAERQVSYLLKTLPNSYVICLDHVCEYDDIPQNQIIYLSKEINNNLKKLLYFPFFIWKIRKLLLPIAPNSVLISLNSLPHILHFLLLWFVPVKSIFSIRSTLSQSYNASFLQKTYLGLLVNIYKMVSSVVVNSFGSKIDLEQLGLDHSKVRVISNMYEVDKIKTLANIPLEKDWSLIFNSPTLIQVGRFNPAKGHKYLIAIFHKLLIFHQSLKLVLIGKNGFKNQNIELCKSLGLRVFDWETDVLHEEYDVYFAGHQQNPYQFVKKSSIFVLPSLYEGLPNVLIEALISGAACVSADCPSGPREILAPKSDLSFVTNKIEYTPYGVLLPPFPNRTSQQNDIEVDVLENLWVEALLALLGNPEQLNELRSKATERGNCFDVSEIIQQWQEVIY